MNTRNITIGILSTLLVGALIYMAKRSKEEKRLIHIADAGYETAHDVLYPLKSQRWRKQDS